MPVRVMEETMKKLSVLAASVAVALCTGTVAATAGVAPGIGEAAKAVVAESKAGVVDQVRWRRHHHHRRHYVVIVPRYYSYRRW